MPPETTGLPYACEPSSATHLTFFFALTSHVVGSPFMLEIMLRSGVPPHIGQSPPPGSDAGSASEASATITQVRNASFLSIGSLLKIRSIPNVPTSNSQAAGSPHFPLGV